MGSVSAARELQAMQRTPEAPARLAKVLQFRRREPLHERIPQSCLAPVIPISRDAQKIVNAGYVMELKIQYKDKGHHSRADASISDAWKLAWWVWWCYVRVFSEGGLRVSEESKRVQYHERLHTGTK